MRPASLLSGWTLIIIMPSQCHKNSQNTACFYRIRMYALAMRTPLPILHSPIVFVYQLLIAGVEGLSNA